MPSGAFVAAEQIRMAVAFALMLSFAHGSRACQQPPVQASGKNAQPLSLLRHDVLALSFVEMRGTLDGEVVAFRGSRGPDDFSRISTKKICDLSQRGLDCCLCIPPIDMDARCRISEMFGQVRQERDTTRGSTSVVAM
jgi:hypothetical protein